MTIFKVSYSSLTAHYGPRFIDAEDEREAKRIFAGGAFSEGEMTMITAREATIKEIQDSRDEL
jgi:hypothetical protein